MKDICYEMSSSCVSWKKHTGSSFYSSMVHLTQAFDSSNAKKHFLTLVMSHDIWHNCQNPFTSDLKVEN